MIYRLDADGGQMQRTAVMVRAVDDEPLARIAIAAGKGVVDVIHDDADTHGSIGVPQRRVFAHDERLFRRMCSSYQAGQREILSSLWTHAMVGDVTGLPARVPAIEPRSSRSILRAFILFRHTW